MTIDKERIYRIKQALRINNLAALLCRLPENVLFLSGWWPLTGSSWVIFTADGSCHLVVPACEAKEAQADGIIDMSTYEWCHLKALDPISEMQAAIRRIAYKFGIESDKIGIEENFESVATPLAAGEISVLTPAMKQMIQQALPKANLIDATEVINNLRLCKTPFEVEKLRIANEIAAFGLAAFKDNAAEGVSEIELAAEVNKTIAVKGSGYKQIKSARSFAQVASAEGTERGWRMCEITSNRKLQKGDIVLLELGTVTDGFWADNTRVAVVGQPNDKQQEIHSLILKAQKAAINAIKPQVKMSDIDSAARAVIDDAGFGQYFIHITGHGIGWRWHEIPPILGPGNDELLQEGMVVSVEPGVYIPGFGGMRNEDIVAVAQNGADLLSSFESSL